MEGIDLENFKSKSNVIDVTSYFKPYSFLSEGKSYDTESHPHDVSPSRITWKGDSQINPVRCMLRNSWL